MSKMLHKPGGIMKIAPILLAAVLTPLWAQQIKLPANFEKLAAKADETVDVTLDGSLLKIAGRFLSGKSDDEVMTKKVLSRLESTFFVMTSSSTSWPPRPTRPWM